MINRRVKALAACAGVVVVAALLAACDPPDFALAVPNEYKSFFQVAARRCPGVLTPAGLAAQASAESGFNPSAKSRAGAEGMMQIIPSVWQVFGTDANGDGNANPYSAADSIATSAKYNCYLSGQLDGDKELRLAAYNAGLAAVRKYDGIPPYPETEQYVEKVLHREQAFADDFT